MALFRLPAGLRQWAASPPPACLTTAARQRGVRQHDPGFDTSTVPDPLPTDLEPVIPETTPLLELSSATLNRYTTTRAPNPVELKYASAFFRYPPQKLWNALHFRDLPPSPFPEVTFLGRSNVGKSSLLNAIFGRTREQPAHISKKPGRTRSIDAFGVTGAGADGLTAVVRGGEKNERWRRFPTTGILLVDMPGYGEGSHREWGQEILKYLERRKQLRRTFVLVNAQHGLKEADVELLTHLRRQGISHQIVLSKVDTLLDTRNLRNVTCSTSDDLADLRRLCEDMCAKLDAAAGDGRKRAIDVLCCSSGGQSVRTRGRQVGINELRWAVLSACGVECNASGKMKRPNLEDFSVLKG